MVPGSTRSEMSRARHRRGRVALSVLVAVSAAAAHHATYLMAFGQGAEFDTAMTASGHDGYWAPMVAAIVAATIGLGMVAVRELRRLAARAGRLSGGGRDEAVRSYWSSATRLWLRLATSTAIAYVVLENVERSIAGIVPIGLDALAGHGLLSLVVILGASLAVALVAALVSWRCQVLIARIAANAGRQRLAAPLSPHPATSIRPPTRPIGSAGGIRAPPRQPIAA